MLKQDYNTYGVLTDIFNGITSLSINNIDYEVLEAQCTADNDVPIEVVDEETELLAIPLKYELKLDKCVTLINELRVGQFQVDK